MRHFYVACDFGAEHSSVALGSLNDGQLSVSEIAAFPNVTVQEKGSRHWNVPELYSEAVAALKTIGSYEETISGLSCTSFSSDYMLFDNDGALITPTFHHSDPRADEGLRKVSSRVPPETIYEETGMQSRPGSALFQLGCEKSKRLDRATHLMPLADGFNYLFAGVPKVEISMASATQLFNPVHRQWSNRLVSSLKVPSRLLPQVVDAGTRLGKLRPDIARQTHVEGASVIASCSLELAAALAAIPAGNDEDWAFLHIGNNSTIGTNLPFPLINEESRHAGFTNELGYDGAIRFSKEIPGTALLNQCRQAWTEQQREIEFNHLLHMASSSPPFESLIDVLSGDVLKQKDVVVAIQDFCRTTNQPIPRKPAQIARCVLESIALHYRKALNELEALAGTRMSRVYVVGDASNSLLNHFIANALQVPVVLMPSNIALIGNVLIQAIAFGHLPSLQHARELVRKSVKTQTILPHANAWDAAFERLEQYAA
jgi:rhamnulokinase